MIVDSLIKKSTARAFLWSRILAIPFWSMITTLSLILYKELHVSPFLLTLIIALKPMTALFATYWSCFFSGKNRNFVLNNIIKYAPFLFFLYIDSPWFSLLSFTLYMILNRASMPVWVELFKNHVPDHSQSKLFALGNTLEYLGTTIIPLIIGIVLDYDSHSWRWLFPVTAILGIASTLVLLRLPNLSSTDTPKKQILHPWKQAQSLIKEKPDYRRYLLGFMLGGAGLMIIQPVLPVFFVDELQFSYTEMLLALSVCKGIGYVIGSPFWVKLFKKLPIFDFSFFIVLLALSFPLLLMGGKWFPWITYIAYLIYGYMQSGSELSWHLSPVSFAKEEASLKFSETNILAVGLRGCIVPFIGSLVFWLSNSLVVMGVAALLAFSAGYVLMPKKKEVILGG